MSDTCDNIGVYNFTCVLQNQGFNVEFEFEETDPVAPIDLTQYDAIRMDIMDDMGKVVKEMSLGDGLTIVGADDNVLRVTFVAADTLVLTRTSYKYDILFVHPVSENTYFIQGSFPVLNTITR
jgi:hypothetical protein